MPTNHPYLIRAALYVFSLHVKFIQNTDDIEREPGFRGGYSFDSYIVIDKVTDKINLNHYQIIVSFI